MVELEIVLESQDFSGSRFRGFHMAQKTVLSKPLKWLLLRKPLKWPLPKPKDFLLKYYLNRHGSCQDVQQNAFHNRNNLNLFHLQWLCGASCSL